MTINHSLLTISRRDLLAASAGMASAMLLPAAQTSAQDGDSPQFRIVDTNVSLLQWPFRRLPLDDSAALAEKLHSLGITEAWAGSFEGVLQRDIAGVNSRLVEECQKHRMFVPIGSVNPALPGWKGDLRRCLDEYKMIGIRLHPNYHGYTLDSPEFAQLLDLATEAGRFVQLAVSLEDTRTQPEQLQVADVDLSPLPAILKTRPKARVQLLNHKPSAAFLKQLAELPGVYFDTARVEGTDGIPRVVEAVPAGRVLFGSHAPFLIPEAALIRTHESGLLDEPALRAVLSGNAEQFRKGGAT